MILGFTSFCIGLSWKQKLSVISFLVPGGPPLSLTANNASSTSIFVSWNPIEEELQHGIILGYSIAYKKENATRRKRRSLSFTDNVVVVENILAWTLEGLEKFTDYCIQIVGFNSKGDGNSSDIVCVSTDEDGKYYIPLLLRRLAIVY